MVNCYAITTDDSGIPTDDPGPGIHYNTIFFGNYRTGSWYNFAVVGLVTASGYWLLFLIFVVLSSPDRVLWILILSAITADCLVKMSDNPDSD